ncbi:hypothetical protein VNO77_23290 [Canavalia gladiata]|uniref:Uncharacterized protein n=1 Tax=Canavalia gladiata TaxID=3824 RepID=A0AAN9KRU6_CANGL
MAILFEKQKITFLDRVQYDLISSRFDSWILKLYTDYRGIDLSSVFKTQMNHDLANLFEKIRSRPCTDSTILQFFLVENHCALSSSLFPLGIPFPPKKSEASPKFDSKTKPKSPSLILPSSFYRPLFF